jgi:hypothetical protein
LERVWLSQFGGIHLVNLSRSKQIVSQRRFQIAFIVIIVLVGVAIRLAAISVFANTQYKPVDVYYADTQAAQLILGLKNPYVHTYIIHEYTLDVFAYLPFVPIYYAIFVPFGDIRYGSIFADILIMLSVYLMAKATHWGIRVYAPLAFAVFPASIWLTSVASTNIMVGSAFFLLSIAVLERGKFIPAAVFLGLGVAASQLTIIALPLVGVYFWKNRKFSSFTLALLVPVAIALPFFLASPSRFIDQVVLFQFERSLQPDGLFSLYSLVQASSGIQLSTLFRIIILLILTFAILLAYPRKPSLFVPMLGLLLFSGAFVLPVNGFWNYFLPSCAVGCAVLPQIIDELNRKTAQIKWWPHPSVSTKQIE